MIETNLVGQPVNSPLGSIPGVSNTVRAVATGFGTVLTGTTNDQMSVFHSASITIVRPCIQVVKRCADPAGLDCFPAGVPINFTGYVTNCGDINLTHVTVVDSRAGQLIETTTGSPLLQPLTLDTNQAVFFSGSFTPELEEICAGSATDTITVRGTDTTLIGGSNASVTNSTTASCAICVNPCLTVTSSCDTVGAGQANTLNGAVTNCGNLALTNIVIVDNRYGTLAAIPTLAPGQSQYYSARVTNHACGRFPNLVTATGSALCGLPVSARATNTCVVCDIEPPTFTCPANQTNQCGGAALTFGTPTASDPCGTVTLTVLSTVTNLTCGNTFVATRTWSAADQCGNSNLCHQTIATVDTTAPVVTCAANKTVPCGTTWSFDHPAAFDTCCGTNLNYRLIGSNLVSGSQCQAVWAGVWQVSDCCSNSSTICTQLVTVVDTTPPVITCASNQTVECGTAWSFNPPSAFDLCCGTNLTVELVSSNATVLSPCQLLWQGVWRATDCCTNSATCTQTASVVDTTAPVVTCAANKTVPCGTTWSFDRPAAFDTCCGTNLNLYSLLTFETRAGATYFVKVDGVSGQQGLVTLNWQANLTNFQWVALEPKGTGTLFIDRAASHINRVFAAYAGTNYTDLRQVPLGQPADTNLVSLEVVTVVTNRSYLVAVEPAAGFDGGLAWVLNFTVQHAPAPALADTLVVSWEGQKFRLQSVASLPLPNAMTNAIWKDATNEVDLGNLHYATNRATGGSTFYRLATDP